jgi:hypothetical protein
MQAEREVYGHHPTVYGHHHTGKQSLDINFLKAERHSAVPVDGHGGNGSRLYELNTWMWRYGRGQPRRVTVAEAKLQRKARITNARKRAASTLKRSREERWADHYTRRSHEVSGESSSD